MKSQLMLKGPKSHPVWCIILMWTFMAITYSIYCINQYSVTMVRVKHIDLENFKFLTNTQKSCDECDNGFLLVILVHTGLSNIKKRTAIRDTWGKRSKCVKVLYFMGTSTDGNLMEKIQEENDKYHDIIQGNFLDTYRNMTYKHVMALKWASVYCRQARYVVKADDDVMVRPDVLSDLLQKDTWGAKDLIACIVMRNSTVFRNKSKWTVTKEEYSEERYPDYCLGPFIIYSADVVHRLVEESYRTPYFWIDDVYVTGILARKIGLKPHVNIQYKWYLFNTNVLFKEGPGKVKPFIFGPIERTPEDIYKMWRVLEAGESWNVTSI